MFLDHIMICNPVDTLNYKLLHTILSNKTNSKITKVKTQVELKSLTASGVDLIFFFIDSTHQEEVCHFLNQVSTLFNSVPIIGISKKLDVCERCFLLRNKLWGIVDIPVNESDIDYLIQNLFYRHDDLTVDKVEHLIKSQLKDELLFGNSEVIKSIKNKICHISAFDVNVLINGESGTGKELCAKMIHYLSNRSKEQFVAINCGAIPEELFENELFGHKKGAYTHADDSETGLIKEADGGSLFLDEVEALSQRSQVKLLRFLEEKKFKPLGQVNYESSDVRIIAAVKGDIEKMIRENEFREDLYYRLNVVEINLPPLRKRKEDIPVLTSCFINRYAKLYNKKLKGIKSSAIFRLMSYDWPGNVRELENIVQEAIVANNCDWIYPEQINIKKTDTNLTGNHEPFNTAKQKMIEEFEINYIKNALKLFTGNIKLAAEYAGKDRRLFYKLIDKYHIDVSEYRSHGFGNPEH